MEKLVKPHAREQGEDGRAGGGMRNAEDPSRMNKADVSVHLCKTIPP